MDFSAIALQETLVLCFKCHILCKIHESSPSHLHVWWPFQHEAANHFLKLLRLRMCGALLLYCKCHHYCLRWLYISVLSVSEGVLGSLTLCANLFTVISNYTGILLILNSLKFDDLVLLMCQNKTWWVWVGELQYKERLAAALVEPGIRTRQCWAELNNLFTISRDLNHVPLLWFKAHHFSWLF